MCYVIRFHAARELSLRMLKLVPRSGLEGSRLPVLRLRSNSTGADAATSNPPKASSCLDEAAEQTACS